MCQHLVSRVDRTGSFNYLFFFNRMSDWRRSPKYRNECMNSILAIQAAINHSHGADR
jgi:hypothetical protein